MDLISIVIPAKNEENQIKDTIEQIIEKFKSHYLEYEIIVIDDGSTDNTAQVVSLVSPPVNCVNTTDSTPDFVFNVTGVLPKNKVPYSRCSVYYPHN